MAQRYAPVTRRREFCNAAPRCELAQLAQQVQHEAQDAPDDHDDAGSHADREEPTPIRNNSRSSLILISQSRTSGAGRRQTIRLLFRSVLRGPKANPRKEWWLRSSELRCPACQAAEEKSGALPSSRQGRRVQVGRNAFRPRRIVRAVLTFDGKRAVNQEQKSGGARTRGDRGQFRDWFRSSHPPACAAAPIWTSGNRRLTAKVGRRSRSLRGRHAARGGGTRHRSTGAVQGGQASIQIRALNRPAVEVVPQHTTLC